MRYGNLRLMGALRLLTLPPLLWAGAACAAEPPAAGIETTSQPADATAENPSGQAADATASPPAPAEQPAVQAAPANDGKWHFAGIGYGWLAGAYGTTKLGRLLPPVAVEMSPKDTIKALKFVVMGAGELRHDRLIFIGDLMWAHLGQSAAIKIRDRTLLSGSLSTKTLAVTALGGYRLIDNGPVTLDLLAGARLNGVNLGLRASGPNRSISGRAEHKWVDPVLASRLVVPLGGKFSASAYGDIAGIVWGSDFSWQALGTLNYQVSRKMRLGLGWRYFKLSYDTGDTFAYRVAQSGPIILFRTDF